MKTMEKEKFLELVGRITSLKDEMKELREEIKEVIAQRADEYEMESKTLKKSINEYVKFQKDNAEYIAEEREVDQILSAVISL